MELYNKISFGISKLITKKYSTSFSLGIMAFDRKYRDAIYSIYGFVRLADEIVDTFFGFQQRELLKKLRQETELAIKTGISINPILHSFAITVKKYNIDYHYIDAFLNSMEMDLDNSYYNKKEYDQYVYGSAEVVGLMCLKVFCNDNEELFNKLIKPARALGSAFQKVNFLRDIKSDLTERDRIYLPGINSVQKIDDESKKNLENEIENEFNESLVGIKQLPDGVKLGVYSAYLYYLSLFKRIKRKKVKELMKKRIRVPNGVKMALLLRGIIELKLLKEF
ncbi:MAG: phytoene/squalene synthase family protein [Ignavibacterium sp.]|nr:phytoene/squalene synthase family protein [Ignavibacterium sp.]